MKIEDIITQNRHRFDADELPVGYLDDFRQRLRAPARRRWTYVALSTIAAATVAVVLMLQMQLQNEVQQDSITELQAYYERQQQHSIDVIEQLLLKVDSVTQAQIRFQLLVMKRDDAEFRREFRPEITKDRYTACEVRYYKTRQNNLAYIQTILTK